MTQPSPTFTTMTDEAIARRIGAATDRLAYVAPGLGPLTARALVKVMRDSTIPATIILDSDEDACRIGYSDLAALKALHETATALRYPIRREPGLRIALLLADAEVILWSPTPLSVEADPTDEKRNALVLTGSSVETINAAVASDSSDRFLDQAEIGRAPLEPADLDATIEKLEKNPPAPVDLSQKTRVFSTRYQFVESEVRGAEWAGRKIKLSSLFLNADLPEALQDVLDTHIRPFGGAADVELEVPLLVRGQRAFDANGKRLTSPATQADVMGLWAEVRKRYLRNLPGFGWLIRRDNLEAFERECTAFEEVLTAWVTAFREHVDQHDVQLVASITSAIRDRLGRATRRAEGMTEEALEAQIRAGLDRLRVIEPRVRIVLKNVSWESSRDEEFGKALKKAIPKEELKNWFEEFTALPERS